MKFLLIPMLILIALVVSQSPTDAETKKVKTAKFTVKVAYAVKADKAEFPKSLSDFKDALQDAAKPHKVNKFVEYSSHSLSALMNKECEEKLNILEYKIVIKPTSYEKEVLKATISLVKIQTKKTKVLFKGKFSIKKSGILVLELGKHKDGVLFVPVRLDSVS